MTISEVINQLKLIQKEHGDIQVLGSCDEEQNCIADVFDIQVGELTKDDQYPNATVKVGDPIVVIIPAM